jgi:hypothetical protein
METMANPHTPEELAALSTFVHNLAGWFVLALAAGMLVEAVRGAAAGRWRYAWPAVGSVVGFGLTAFIFLHQALYHRISPLADPVQNQHQLIGLLFGLGAAVELWRRRRGEEGRLLASAWPLALVGVGVVFLVHEQGTLEALLVHWALAGTLVVAGLALLAAALSGEAARALRIFAVLLLAAAAVQLVVFREHPGAHGEHGAAISQPGHRH